MSPERLARAGSPGDRPGNLDQTDVPCTIAKPDTPCTNAKPDAPCTTAKASVLQRLPHLAHLLLTHRIRFIPPPLTNKGRQLRHLIIAQTRRKPRHRQR